MKLRIVGLLLPLLTLAAIAGTPALIPLPQQMQVRPGVFTLCPAQPMPGVPGHATTKILVDGASFETGQYLAALLFKSTGYQFQVGANGGSSAVKGAILLTTVNANSNLGAEGYELTVAPDSVVIRAPAPAGVFYGVQSLLQLLPPEVFALRPVRNVQWVLPCVYIQDAPRFPWRGWMLDSVRHFFNKDEVKVLLDTMALHKLNMFHWHLDDDAGWRIEIQKWPLLTQVAAWRTNIMFGLNPRSSTAWREDGNYGGFYTQAEVREIVAYATQRHITVVPEIEMPGHSSAPLAAYPQFACGCATCANGPYSLSVTSYVGGVFCVARPETMSFVQDVLTEVMGLFPGPYIHIGGDEVDFGNWNKHSLDQALTNSLGLSSMQQYQGHFTQQVANWIKSQGRKMIGWSEIMNGGLLTNAMVMDWVNGTGSRALMAATNREYVVMTPSATLYINKWETGTSAGTGSGVIWSNEPPGQSGYVPLTNVYAFEPIPTGLPAAYTNYILGLQGNSWAEFIPSLLNMEFKSYPRLCAIAEVGWTAAALKNYTDFTNRLVVHKQRLTQAGVNYNPSAEPPQLGTWAPAQTPASYATLTWDITASVTGPGEIDVSFCWKTGANGLDIAWAAVLENGVEIDRDTHAGFTGVTPTRPAYVLRLRTWRRGATYTLAASVQGRGGTSSSGVVYRPNWD
jgi:hexosaminidase